MDQPSNFENTNTPEPDTLSPIDLFFQTQNSNTDMLYAAIPYVAMSFKKPLALLIKMQEMQEIMHGFDNSETLSACGLNESSGNAEEMLQAMRGKAHGALGSKLDFILNFIQAEKIIKTYRTIFPVSQPQNTISSSNDLLAQILPLLVGNHTSTHTDLLKLAEQIQNAAKGANNESELAN